MKPTLFWAWQSDAENNVCRGFIRLSSAWVRFASLGQVFDSVRVFTICLLLQERRALGVHAVGDPLPELWVFVRS
jgi:hypothetical protein